MTLPDYLKREIENIGSDNVNSAEVLMQRSVEVFRLIGEDERIHDAEELLRVIGEAARSLAKSQPAMAGLFNIANAFLWATDDVGEIRRLRSIIAETADRFVRSGEDHLKLIAEYGSRLIQTGHTVITHSNSRTVLHSLLEAKKSGKDFIVICTESRPMMEGIALAAQLRQSGINVNLVSDAGIFTLIEKANWVFLGADTVGIRGLVNKAGSLAMATESHRHGIPCYTLCSTLKFSPLPKPTPLSPYFDLTPLELLAGIITEEGTISPQAAKGRISALNVHPILR
jgi:translation initiation factor 2B subunit (eIF-2B alpha/beta/delta family)